MFRVRLGANFYNGFAKAIVVFSFARIIVLAGVVLAPGAADLRAQATPWEQAVNAGDQALEGGNYQRAEELYETALAQARAFAETDARKARTLFRLARLFRARGDYAKPESLYLDGLSTARQALGQDDVEYARMLHEVGRYYHARRKYDLAEEYYKNAFGTRVRALGKEHADVAESINDLAILFENQAILPKAEVYYETALGIREKALGLDHIQTIETTEHFARLLFKTQQTERAEALTRRGEAFRKARVAEAGAGIAPFTGKTYSAADGASPPELKERTEPDYTEEARLARHEGAVALQVVIGADGKVHQAELLRSLGLGLDERALEAVRQWTFRPAKLGKKEVAFRATLEINFRLL